MSTSSALFLQSANHSCHIIGISQHCYMFKVYRSTFSAMFSKGDNFMTSCFAYLEYEVFPKKGLLLMERICSDGSKFFPL